jgi:hypothetical protein
MEKKGQAAIEFLMTYGWAILAAIIAIGVLAYFGVFSPGKYITGSAVVNPPFYVNAWNVQSTIGTDGGVNLELRNNGGEDYQLYSINVAGCGTYTGAPDAILAGSTGNFQVTCGAGTGLTAGQTFKGDITISYRKTGSSVDLTSTGTVAEKIT